MHSPKNFASLISLPRLAIESTVCYACVTYFATSLSKRIHCMLTQKLNWRTTAVSNSLCVAYFAISLSKRIHCMLTQRSNWGTPAVANSLRATRKGQHRGRECTSTTFRILTLHFSTMPGRPCHPLRSFQGQPTGGIHYWPSNGWSR